MKKLLRRNFLKSGMAALGGIAVLARPLFAWTDKNNQANETLNTINNLRTIHGDFNEKNIPDEHLQIIQDASIRAANASNMQTYSIITIKDRDKMKNMCGYQGSCLLLYCVDYNRHKMSAEYLGNKFYMNNIVAFVTGSMNTMLAAQTAVIAAKSLGIDSLLTNGIHRGDMERVWKTLDLPEKDCFPLIALLLGYPNEEPTVKKGRLDGPGIFHTESYHTLTNEDLETIVKKYDDKDAHIGLNDNWEGQGHKHYLDWLYKSWLGGSDKPIDHETQMFKLLKRSGFIDMQG